MNCRASLLARALFLASALPLAHRSGSAALITVTTIGGSGATELVSWPLFAQDFQVDQSDLSPPISWSPAPYPYTTNPTGVAVSVPATGRADFFRLRK